MAGYIGSKASVVSSGAERKKVFNITTSTTVLTGLSYTANQVHVFHNGVRLISGTDYTETNDTTITLTNAAENGDQVVVVSYASFQTSDTVSASAGGTFSGDVTVNGDLTVDTNTLYVDSANNRVGIGNTSPTQALDVTGDIITSGGVYLGGVGSANKLDDYEEGSFSPLLSDGTNTVSLGTGKYTKIGRSVLYFIQAYNVNISSLTASAQLRITGFPFSFQSSNPVYANSLFSQREPEVTGIAESAGTTMLLYKGENNAVDYGLFTRNVWGGATSATFRGKFFANID